MATLNPPNRVLLTGAGFTKNFGGLLANEMWVEIHNRVLRTDLEKLINAVKAEFNYEELYEKIIKGDEFDETEKNAFTKAVIESYQILDNMVCDYAGKSYLHLIDISLEKVSDFIAKFSPGKKETGFFFTLNQDLFIERFYRNTSRPKLLNLGLPIKQGRFKSSESSDDSKLRDKDLITIPSRDEVDRKMEDKNIFTEFNYVKLHGSLDWRDQSNERRMVIGTSKPKEIKKEPMLSWYIDIFKEVLAVPNQRLLIIGYGFSDPHINKILVKSIKENNLKLYIISPISPEKFRSNNRYQADNMDDYIWEAIYGYYPYLLKTLFPNHSLGSTTHFDNLIKDFFEE